MQERFGKCRQHPQTQCHHRGCFLPLVRHPPRGDYVCDREVFQGENEGFLKEHRLLKRESWKKAAASLRPRTCDIITLILLPRQANRKRLSGILREGSQGSHTLLVGG